MNTGQLFSQKQLIAVSGLSETQIKQLHKYNLLTPTKNPVRYRLTDAIYCRIIYWLRQYYSSQQMRQFIYSCDKYSGKLLNKKYGIIEFTDGLAIELELINNLDSNISKHLETTYIYRDVRQIADKFKGQIDVNYCYLNLEAIRDELLDRAYEYNLDSIEQKFRMMA